MQAGKVLMQSMLWRGLYYVTAFVINILIARHFQASASGAVYYISSIYALVVLLTSLSLESGIIYFAAKNEIPVSRLFSFSVAWSLLIGLIVFLVVFFFFTNAYPKLPGNLLLISSITFICGNLLTTYCTGFFYAHNNYSIPNIINISSTLFLIVTIPYNGRSIIPGINNENYFYVYFASFFVQGTCMAIVAKFKYVTRGIKHFLSLREFKLLFGYCAMAFAGNIIHLLLYRVDYFFVEKYCTAAELGNYIQVSKLVNLFFIIPTILASAVFPLTAGGQTTGIIRLLTILSRCVFAAYFLICLLLVLTGKKLFPYIFGESFSNMYEPFLLLIPGILAFSGIFTITAYFAGKNKIKYNIIGSALALLVIFTGDIMFIPKYGILAAAAVSSVGYLVYQVYVLVIINKEFKTNVGDFYFLRITDIKKIKKIFLGK